ncbi:conserved hypothetical protein [Segniliparus rotundus DSM 44985]|uniref:Plasmid pRiA4b Orf3-like domain-containing protein n=1 Tax=Segniliparus rotundus (strain ATCC BAA-972 / CDC 1076 / CIP 108378 / DSM 44985 / JCM 13578) TaxID=640132 RepID=D6ZAS0_SEGRD|nr:hypothetical protein [Segniliparus rotundus]ADG98806.1 conserved hypothetical protein [Segniliparus rotundus DSM 44985]
MARTWLSIQVTLVEGRGEFYWPRPGRVFAAARSHTFLQLAQSVDLAFARWDRGHLHAFDLQDGTRIGVPEADVFAEGLLDGEAVKLSRLALGERFAYEFDFGDRWTHLCEVAPEKIDPLDEFATTPLSPAPYWGWGEIPDQYGRRFDSDDGESKIPPDPERKDLPPLRPWWGDQRRSKRR